MFGGSGFEEKGGGGGGWWPTKNQNEEGKKAKAGVGGEAEGDGWME